MVNSGDDSKQEKPAKQTNRKVFEGVQQNSERKTTFLEKGRGLWDGIQRATHDAVNDDNDFHL